MRRAARSPAVSRSLSLSPYPSLTHTPSLFLTAPPHPFVFSLLLSFPLHTHIHTAICTSLALAFDNYRCAISSHVRQKGSPPIVLRVTNNA